jgi:CIC family chloride channel protein
MERFIGEERHHGVGGVVEATALAGGRLRYRRMPINAAVSSFSLGAGASVGPEDPSVQIGANLGSMFGQWLRLSDEWVKLLVAAGAAGGIAAAFRAPIAGVFFALEAILSDTGAGI